MRRIGLVLLVVLSLVLHGPLPVAAQGHPGDCTEQDLSESTAAIDGVTVVYDDHNLVNLQISPNAADYAETIAELVRDEAVEARATYQALGLGAHVAPSLTIQLRCDVVVFPVLAEPPAYTPGASLIQINLTQVIWTDFGPSITETAACDAGPACPGNAPELTDAVLRTPLFEWVETIHHEMFHTLQWDMAGPIDFLNDYANYLDHTRYESGAVLAQDLFDADDHDASVAADDLGQAVGGSYWLHLQQLLADPVKSSIDQTTFDRDTAEEQRAYQAGAILQYWAERFGDGDPADLEARAAAFLVELTQAEGHGIAPMQAALGRDVFDALRDFWVTAYAHNRGAQPDGDSIFSTRKWTR